MPAHPADGAIGIAEMLFCTSLVAQVGAGEQPSLSPRRLQLTNTKVGERAAQPAMAGPPLILRPPPTRSMGLDMRGGASV